MDNGIIYSLIYDVDIKDDVFVRQLATTDLPGDELLRPASELQSRPDQN